MATCVGLPDFVKGSTSVLISGIPTARLGEITAQVILFVVGCPTIMIRG
jgi:uncharacterized Zn-binding protein involved in type VI secretion